MNCSKKRVIGQVPSACCISLQPYITPGPLKNDHTNMRDLAATTLAVFPHFFIASLDHIFLPRMEMMEKEMLQ